MHRTMFSGGSIPLASDQSRKNRHGRRSWSNVTLEWINTVVQRTYFQPDDHKIPEADHAQLQWCITPPSFCVFDCDHVHVVEYDFHDQKADEESHQVARECPWSNIHWSAQLRR